MAPNQWPGIRPGSTRVSVYNEALLAFLYDESYLPKLKESEADFESGYGETDADTDKMIKKLAKEAILIAYELPQDESLEVEVLVGPALTKVELKKGRWYKPQLANVNLPSGTLRIDSANTLPMNVDIGDDTEEPGIVKVPPGDYVISLYRLDWDLLISDGIVASAEEWSGPNEVVVLTPAAVAKPVKTNKPLLRFVKPAEPWIGKYAIDGKVFKGKAYAKDSQALFLVNIDRVAESTLELTKGMMVKVEVGEFVAEGVFAGEAEMPGKIRLHVERGSRKEFAIVFRMTSWIDDDRDHKLVFERVIHTQPFPVLEKWIPATVTPLEERYPM